jgi:geranylgeranyl diphosphate synthase type I
MGSKRVVVIQRIRVELLSVPELASWPELATLIERPTDEETLPCWELPVLACQAVGGGAEQAWPGAAAIFCLLYSIHLVDDLLDHDPRGLHVIHGEGRVANFALALQAAGSLIVERTELAPERRASIHRELARAALATAYGQHLDLDDFEGEDEYWKVVETKTPPLFAGALAIGGSLGQASAEIVETLRRLGFLVGKTVQISDDLKDAFEKPAAPDWSRRYNNLPILYSLTADHLDRQLFSELLADIEEQAALERAQDILVRSGAVSFCVYQMIELHRSAKELIREARFVDPRPLEEMLERYVRPLKGLLEKAGIENLETLFD